ncbi:MAG: hypothetical protein IKK34_01220 [Clostridia bacterium]|nr:hypothetical protein [Clostridia bacterium]
MTRVLRFPRLSALLCAMTIACALLRDVCVGASLYGWAQVLLTATVVLLALCLIVMSSRFFVDHRGVGVGFLLRSRRVEWEELASFGVLYCNSKRRYFYGMYRSRTDFLDLLHRAPYCGPWGFVVPVSDRLMRAVLINCPIPVDLSPMPAYQRTRRLRAQWHQAALHMLVLIPVAAVAFLTGTLMLLQAAVQVEFASCAGLTLGAMALYGAGLTLLYRVLNTMMTCPGFNETGVCAGRGLYIPWENVRFGYVHRVAKMSGMFLLSQPLDVVTRRNAPPILCLSMPDTSTMLLAYLTYCPHADKGLRH